MVHILAATLLVLASSGTASAPAARVAAASAKNSFCARGPVGFFQLHDAISRYLNLCLGTSACKGVLSGMQTIVLAGYSKPWLWSMTTSGSTAVPPFSVTDQDIFIQNAKALAQAATPTGKTMINFEVFTDIVPAASVTGHYVGARATYGICTAVKQH